MRQLPLSLSLVLIALPGDPTPSSRPGAEPSQTRELASAYIDEVLVGRDWDAAEVLTAEDMRFTDPTAAIWGLPLAQGIRGRSTILKTMKGFGVSEVAFERVHEFTSGPMACFVGYYSSGPVANPSVDRARFVSILTVEEGAIAERLDYGDYDQLIGSDLAIDGLVQDLDHPLVVTANRYLAAYSGRDFATMARLLHPDATFQDRTASAIGMAEVHRGGDAVAAFLRSVLEPSKSFEIRSDFKFYFQDHAVFAGVVSYALQRELLGMGAGVASFEHEFLMVLRIVDGKVISHLDFADYDTYLEQVAALGHQ